MGEVVEVYQFYLEEMEIYTFDSTILRLHYGFLFNTNIFGI